MAPIIAGVVPQQPPMICAPRSRVRGELGEVLGRRVRVDDLAAEEARARPMRSKRSDGRPLSCICSSGGQGREQAGAGVCAEGGDLKGAEALRCLPGGDAGERGRVLVGR